MELLLEPAVLNGHILIHEYCGLECHLFHNFNFLLLDVELEVLRFGSVVIQPLNFHYVLILIEGLVLKFEVIGYEFFTSSWPPKLKFIFLAFALRSRCLVTALDFAELLSEVESWLLNFRLLLLVNT